MMKEAPLTNRKRRRVPSLRPRRVVAARVAALRLDVGDVEVEVHERLVEVGDPERVVSRRSYEARQRGTYRRRKRKVRAHREQALTPHQQSP